MAWQLSHWLALTRTFQLLVALAAGMLNGFLVAWIKLRHLGLKKNIVVMELLLAIMVIYMALALGLQHTSGRSKRSGWLAAFIAGDILFVGVDIGLISLLAHAGLPSMCVGLTEPDFDPIKHPDQPGYGYTTRGFSDQTDGHRGELDNFCTFDRAVYIITVGLLFTRLATILLSVLRICEGRYTENTKVLELLDSLKQAKDEKEQRSPLLQDGPRFIPPPSEGIITRQTSLRSVATTRAGAGPHGSPPAIPRRPVPNRLSVGLAISPINEAAETRNVEEYDALVADGMRRQPQQQQRHENHSPSSPVQQHPPSEPMLTALDDIDRSSLSEVGMVADGMQYRPDRQHTQGCEQIEMRGTYTSVPLTAAALDEGAAALVSDGSRPMPTLPPYTPGSSRTDGQAAVQPRVQDMKPNGYFMQ